MFWFHAPRGISLVSLPDYVNSFMGQMFIAKGTDVGEYVCGHRLTRSLGFECNNFCNVYSRFVIDYDLDRATETRPSKNMNTFGSGARLNFGVIDGVTSIIIEKIHGTHPSSHISRNKVMPYVCQLFKALELAWRKIGYTHNDLHRNNVLIESLPNSVICPLTGLSVNEIPVIIDNEYGSIYNNGEKLYSDSFGLNSRYGYDIISICADISYFDNVPNPSYMMLKRFQLAYKNVVAFLADSAYLASYTSSMIGTNYCIFTQPGVLLVNSKILLAVYGQVQHMRAALANLKRKAEEFMQETPRMVTQIKNIVDAYIAKHAVPQPTPQPYIRAAKKINLECDIQKLIFSVYINGINAKEHYTDLNSLVLKVAEIIEGERTPINELAFRCILLEIKKGIIVPNMEKLLSIYS